MSTTSHAFNGRVGETDESLRYTAHRLRHAMRHRDTVEFTQVFDQAMADHEVNPAASLSAIKRILEVLLDASIEGSPELSRLYGNCGRRPFPNGLRRKWKVACACIRFPSHRTASRDVRRSLDRTIKAIQLADAHSGSTNSQPRYSVRPTDVRLIANFVVSVALFLFENANQPDSPTPPSSEPQTMESQTDWLSNCYPPVIPAPSYALD
jgi:hypothetical protein